MNYLLDTNIVLILSRNSEQARHLNELYQLTSGEHKLYTSIVVLGELNSIIRQKQYGKARRNSVEDYVNLTTVIDIAERGILDAYGKIDSYSQQQPATYKTPPFSSRNMGKNDLWIAATAAHYNLTLLTTDKDFDHLSPEYLQLEFVDQALLK